MEATSQPLHQQFQSRRLQCLRIQNNAKGICRMFCGSQPAGDGGGSGSIDVEADTLIASRLAPTGICGGYLAICDNPDHCRSELARDGGGSGSIDVETRAPIASRLAPTGICGGTQGSRATPTIVGASLLAMTVGRAALMSRLMASSRASSLLQGGGLVKRFMGGQVCFTTAPPISSASTQPLRLGRHSSATRL